MNARVRRVRLDEVLSRAAAPMGETSTGLPLISFTTRNGANRALPLEEMDSNHQRSVSPTYDHERSNVQAMPLAHSSVSSAASSTEFGPRGRFTCAQTRCGCA